jgi:8-oxo-dGTP diphosphatase
MTEIPRVINPHISVDCVIFGFSKNQLKVLLIERQYRDGNGNSTSDLKLPGDFISRNEDLDMAATRTLKELTGLENIFLKQFAVFGNPERISNRIDRAWLKQTTGMEIHRVVTTAYYALIDISESKSESAIKNNASWIRVDRVPDLAFDHLEIIKKGLDHLRNALRNEPIGFELLPGRFTIRELQTLYEAILDCKFDNRNFRKKILKAKHLVQLQEKQVGVPHKPAYYYRFDKAVYEKNKTESLGFNF